MRESETQIAAEGPNIESIKQSPIQQSRKRALLSLFNHHHQHKSSKTSTINQNNPSTRDSLISESSSTTAPYVYIDHEKTTTVKDIAYERLQQQQARRVEV